MTSSSRDFRTELGARFPLWTITGPFVEDVEDIPSVEEQGVDVHIVEALRWRLCRCLTILDGMSQDERYASDTALQRRDNELFQWLQEVSRLRRNNFVAIRPFLEMLSLALPSVTGKNKQSEIRLAVAITRATNAIDDVPDLMYRSLDVAKLMTVADHLDRLLLEVHTSLRTFLASTAAWEDDDD